MITDSPDVTPWLPPTGFVAQESKLQGVTVFGPPPAAPEAETRRTYKCPQCGAATEFNVAAGGVACEHCGYVAVVKADTRAQPLEFTLAALATTADKWTDARRQLHCEGCGADLTLSEGALSTTCPFCASPRVHIQAASADSLRPGGLAPFTVTPEVTRAQATAWLGQGWFHPAGLADSARLDSFRGVYLPYWLFDADVHADWKAEIGYEETETYLDTHDMKRKTRQVVRWRWETGSARVNVTGLPVCGTTRVNAVVLQKVLPFDVQAVKAFTPDYLAGWQALEYDVALANAWEDGKAAMRAQAEAACRSQFRSNHVRNVHVTADFADEAWRYVLLPVYLSAYRFGDRVFQVIVNGQTGTVGGQKPVDWNKVWLAIAAILAPGILLSLIGLPLLLLGGLGMIPLILGLVLFVGGVIGAFILYSRVAENERGVAGGAP